MRSFYGTERFFEKMKKKPAVQAVLDDLENYTEEDIDNLEGTHFPMWIKDELKKLVNRSGKTPDEIAEEIAAQMIAASQKDIK